MIGVPAEDGGACGHLTGLAQLTCEMTIGDGSGGVAVDPDGWLHDKTIGNLARASAEAAETMITAMWSLIMETTKVDPTVDWVRSNVFVVMLVALPVIVMLFLAQLAVAAWQGRPGGFIRAFVGTITSLGVCAVALSAAHSTLMLTDWACDLIMRWRVGVQVGEAIEALTPAMLVAAANGQGAVLPALLIVVFAFLFIAGSFCVWFALMARKALIIVAAVFAPLAFAGMSNKATSSWPTRWLQIMFALAVSKVAVVMVFAIATGAIRSGVSGAADSTLRAIGELSMGLMLLAVAAIAPWLTYKFIDFLTPGGRDFDGTFARAAQTARAGSHSARSVMMRTRSAASTGMRSPRPMPRPAAKATRPRPARPRPRTPVKEKA